MSPVRKGPIVLDPGWLPSRWPRSNTMEHLIAQFNHIFGPAAGAAKEDSMPDTKKFAVEFHATIEDAQELARGLRTEDGRHVVQIDQCNAIMPEDIVHGTKTFVMHGPAVALLGCGHVREGCAPPRMHPTRLREILCMLRGDGGVTYSFQIGNVVH